MERRKLGSLYGVYSTEWWFKVISRNFRLSTIGRHEVAEFIGRTINDLYKEGISSKDKCFDKLVEQKVAAKDTIIYHEEVL